MILYINYLLIFLKCITTIWLQCTQDIIIIHIMDKLIMSMIHTCQGNTTCISPCHITTNQICIKEEAMITIMVHTFINLIHNVKWGRQTSIMVFKINTFVITSNQSIIHYLLTMIIMVIQYTMMTVAKWRKIHGTGESGSLLHASLVALKET